MGEAGPQGPPFATAVVGSVNTLDPWENATVDASFDGASVHFTFGIPLGNDGSSGSDGAPGEVSQVQLDDAINGTSANTNGVTTLGIGADAEYNQIQIQELINKVDELINALRSSGGIAMALRDLAPASWNRSEAEIDSTKCCPKGERSESMRWQASARHRCRMPGGVKGLRALSRRSTAVSPGQACAPPLCHTHSTTLPRSWAP